MTEKTQQKTTEFEKFFFLKIIHKFLSYALSHKEKLTHSYSLNKYILIKLNNNKIQTEFESFYHNIMKHIEHLRQNDQLKIKIRRTCENYYRIEIPY